MTVDSTPRPDLTAAVTAAPLEGAAATVPAPEMLAAPPRPTWHTLTPSAPWCPAEWRDHLERIVPGLLADSVPAADQDATGVHLHTAAWSLVLASRRGRLHAHRGDHREDAGNLASFAGGWCAAVADGAGSAAYSRLGSAIATATVTRHLASRLPGIDATTNALATAMQEAARAANAAQREFAACAGIAWRDLRTTLLVAALHGERVALMQVGDGAMALLHADGTVSHPQAAATGDYSGEVAHFLPDDGALEVLEDSVRVIPAHGMVAVLLASDGVEDPWYPFTRWARPLVHSLAHGVAGHAPADNAASPGDTAALPPSLVPARTASVLQAADPVSALSEWLAFEKRGENDDRTLCLAYTAALLTAPSAS